ncbi:MAG: flippase [Chloroflexi bacterium]|nr:flippase [Chloroflexota bacterium]
MRRSPTLPWWKKIWGPDGFPGAESVEALRTGRRVSANTLWLLLSRFGAQGLMVVFTLVIARRLGESGLGAYAWMGAVIVLGNVLTTAGSDVVLIRQIAGEKDMSLLPAGLFTQLFFSALFAAGVYLAAPYLPNTSPEAAMALRLYSLALFPMAFYSVCSAALRGVERMDAFLWLSLAGSLLPAGLAWALIQPGSSLTFLAGLLVISQVVVALLAGWFCRLWVPGFGDGWTLSRTAVHTLLYLSLPVALLGVLKILYQRSGIFLVTALAGEAATGQFSAALKLVEVLQAGHIAALGALFPMMARSYRHEEGEASPADAVITLSGWLLAGLGVLLAGILFVLAPRLVTILYGEAFSTAVSVTRLLAWMLIPYSVNIYISSLMLSAHQESEIARALLGSLLVFIALSIWWIPLWGVRGAALAALVAEGVQAWMYIHLWGSWMKTAGAGIHPGRRVKEQVRRTQ